MILLSLSLSAPLAGARADSPSATADSKNPRVLTMLDYYESGRRAVEACVLEDGCGSGKDLLESVERAKLASVRVEIRSNEREDRYQSIAASGVLIDGGRRVLTAGHAMTRPADTGVVVTLLDGETRSARILDSRYEVYGGADLDWAVLEILGRPVEKFPAAELGHAREQELVFVLGYPDGIGVDETGSTAFEAGPDAGYLEPLVTLGVVDSREPLRLSPLAGSVPTSGMSGAPVFSEDGRLIGIFVSLGKARTRSTVTYTYNAASVDSFRPTSARSTLEIAVPAYARP